MFCEMPLLKACLFIPLFFVVFLPKNEIIKHYIYWVVDTNTQKENSKIDVILRFLMMFQTSSLVIESPSKNVCELIFPSVKEMRLLHRAISTKLAISIA